jgi:putative molybdopterin biosynthesis protein
LQAALADAVEHADLVLLLAGSSAGRGDYSTDTIRALGEVVLHGLSIRPGKPAVLGICRHKPVIGLPGYPVSGLIVLEEVVRPILRQLYRLNIPDRPEITARLTRRLVSSLKYQEYIRVRLSFIHGLLVAAPLDRGAGILTSYARADGLLVIPRDSEGIESGSVVTVRLLRPLSEIERALSVMGSHDPLLDEVADLLFQEGNPKIFLSSVHVGSMGGLMAIRRLEAHIAGIHLLDETNGEYNLSYVNRYFPDGGVILVEGVRRQQGLLVQSGNPLQIKNLDDIAKRGLRYVNRQKGAGTRLLLDHLLSQLQIAPDQLSGYSREEYTHTGVAAQIAAGSADAGLGILAAARLCQLDFIPVTEECYDFLIDAASWNLPIVQRFIQILRSDGFRQRLTQLGGYHVENPGQIRWPLSHKSQAENR